MPQHTDRFLYFAGSDSGIDESMRAYLAEILASDPDTRRRAWTSLREQSSLLGFALALDLVVQRYMAARMGAGAEIEREYVRAAAIELLRADRIAGQDRWQARAIPAASHIVALRALARVATPEDAALVASLRSGRVESSDWERAWIAAAAAVLRQATGERAAILLQQLLSLSRSPDAEDSTRCEAVLAIDASSEPGVEPALHEVYRTTTGDVQVEAVAALAARNAVDDAQRQYIRELLEGPPASGVVTLRKADLLRALEPPTR